MFEQTLVIELKLYSILLTLTFMLVLTPTKSIQTFCPYKCFLYTPSLVTVSLSKRKLSNKNES